MLPIKTVRSVFKV